MAQDGDNDGSETDGPVVVGWHDGTLVVGWHDGWSVDGEHDGELNEGFRDGDVEGKTDGNQPQEENVLLITYTSLLS